MCTTFCSLDLDCGFISDLRVVFNVGPLRSRAAKAFGFIDDMINYSTANSTSFF